MKLTEFNRNIKNHKFSPVYLFEGPEVNLATRSEKKLKEEAVAPVMEAFNFKRYSQKDMDYNELFASCQTLPIMSENRLIVLDDTSKFMDIIDEDTLDSLEGYLKDPSPSTILVIRSLKTDKRRKIYKLIKKYGDIVEFKKLDKKLLSSFIDSVLKEQKITMDNRTKNFYIDRTHYLDNEDIDTFAIENQLKQLANYTDESGKVDKEMVEEVVPEGIEDNVYKIIDNAVNGNMRNVDEVLTYLFEHGESPVGLFGLVLYQIRNILKVKILLDKGYSQQQISQKLKISNFIIRKTVPLARRFSINNLLKLYREAADMDFKIKTGQLEADYAFEYFLLKLAKA